MAISYMYTNEFGSEIKPQQIAVLRDYYVKVFEDNIFKRLEFYSDGILASVSYKVDSHSQIQDILISNPNASFVIDTISGNYTVSETLSYKEGQLISKSKLAKETITGNIICLHFYDVQTDAIQHLQTQKSFFEDGNEKYAFYYNEDGSCFQVIKTQEYQTDFLATEIGSNPDVDFSWTGFGYYQYSLPLVPIGYL